jgi:hypothetical protein
MWYLIMSICTLGALIVFMGYFRRRNPESGGDNNTSAPPPGCCGQHATCLRSALKSGVGKPIEYYDDEELDRFRETQADAYTDEAAEEFRQVLYTMRTDEVAGWLHSLQMRGINLPDGLKDEAFIIVVEQRIKSLV